MWFEIFFALYQSTKYCWLCALYFLRIVAPHTMKIVFVANLAIAYWSWFTLVEAQEFSNVANAALIDCEEALASEKLVHQRLTEQNTQNFNEKQIKKTLLIGMSLLFLLHWGFLILRLDSSKNGPPGGIPPGENANARLSEELVEVDPSVLVPENHVSPVLELVCKLLVYCLT